MKPEVVKLILDLAVRVNRLEDELAMVRDLLFEHLGPATTVEEVKKRVPLFRKNQSDPEKMKAIVDRVLAEMGIQGEPIGAEKLQQMQLAEGADPTSTECRRWIEEMREE